MLAYVHFLSYLCNMIKLLLILSILTTHPNTKDANVGVMVYDYNSGKTIDSHRANAVIPPASTIKLLTTATVLEVYGENYRIKTPITYTGEIQEGVLNGDIYIEGKGDPTLGSRYVGNQSFLQNWVKEIKKACEKSLLARGFGGTGWALGWKVCLWARLGNAENTLKLIKNQLYPISVGTITLHRGGGSYPNMFDAHPPFQIDGNFGGAAAIANMLVQDRGGEVKILPALPKQFKDGYVKGLCLKGKKAVDIVWKNGEVVDYKIYDRE